MLDFSGKKQQPDFITGILAEISNGETRDFSGNMQVTITILMEWETQICDRNFSGNKKQRNPVL